MSKNERDLQRMAKDVASILAASLSRDLPEMQSLAMSFLKSREKRLKQLTALRLKSAISDAELLSELEDEKLALETKLLSLKVISAMAIQDAANAAIHAIQQSILNCLKIL